VSDQTSIAPGKAEVQGNSSRASGLLVIRVPVSPHPDQYWRELFSRDPHFTGWPMSMASPRIRSDSITVEVPDADIERAVELIGDRIAATNAEYRERVLPELQKEERQRQEETEQRERRLSDAQRRLNDLT
jgi:hypothetical protein